MKFESSHYSVTNKNNPTLPVLLLTAPVSFPVTVGILEVDGTATGERSLIVVVMLHNNGERETCVHSEVCAHYCIL